MQSSSKKVVDYNDTGLIKIIEAASYDDLHSDDGSFQAKHPNQPVLIRGFGKAITNVTEEFVRSLIPLHVLEIYTGDEFIYLSRDEFIQVFLQDKPKRNLLDGSNPPKDGDPEIFPKPTMFMDNYYSGLPVPDPLASVILSTRLSYTKTHIDSSGTGAWMYLIAGEKRWTLYEPRFRSVIYSPRTKIYWDPEAPHAETKEELPFCEEVPCSTVYQKGGDLIWVPPGWAHRVLTTQRAIGYGAFYVSPSIVLQSVESFLSGASYHLPDAYLGHPNMVALKKEHGVDESPVEYSSEKREYHYASILRNCFLPKIGEQGSMRQHKDAVTEAARRVRVWHETQARGAYIYPEDAADVYKEQ